uniref:Phosphatase PP2A regulatory subunit A/Splicing factor 3B subunit 1-like HEAT repeat domain-containing protein n=1 Tax=Panagrolaimus superbus TaxID=310955 RepID=A0A914XWH8_9BILA
MKLQGFCSGLPTQNRAKVFIEQILPVVKPLASDANQHVKVSLASVVMELAPLLGEQTEEHLLPIFLTMLRDDTPEVRLNIISSLDKVSKVIGQNELTTSLLSKIVPSNEDILRVRSALVEYILPLHAERHHQQFFEEKLLKLCMTWLTDPASAICEAATNILKQLYDKFGAEWTVQHIIPKVTELSKDANCLHRMTCLFSVEALAQLLDKDGVKEHLLPIIKKLAEDPIPDVRINVAEAIIEVGKALDPGLLQSEIKPIIQKLSEDDEIDVKVFAQKAKETLSL